MENNIINQRPFPNWGYSYELGCSNNDEDSFVMSYYDNKIINRKRLVVDIGAADGLTGSNSRRLIIEKKWSAVLVEPFLPFYNYLIKLYDGNEDVRIYNNAMDVEEKETTIFYRSNEAGVGLTSLICNWENKQQIVTKNFNNLIENREIDFLSLDTEGKDFEILQTINYDLYKIEIICTEKSVDNHDYNNKIFNFLNSKNYKHVKTTNHNLIFIKQ